MKVLVVITLIVGTFILIRITEMLLRFFIGKRQKLKFIIRYFPIVELITTLSITFWAIDYLFSAKSYYQTIILSLIISIIALVSWFVARDLIFRIQNNIRSGSSLQLGNIEGKMLRMGAAHIVIETNEGKIVKIPYSKVANEIVSEQPEEGVREDSELTLKIIRNKNWKEVEAELKNVLLHSPWRLINTDPRIELLSEEEEYFKIQIFIKTRGKKHTEQLRTYLLTRFGES